MKYESSITYHPKAVAKIKVFADKQRDRPKTICPQSINGGAYKRGENCVQTTVHSITHSLIHHFKTVPNSKKLQTTTEMWLLKDCIENIVEKVEIAHLE